ncbi:MAG: hypothetical protein KGH75_01540 [Rhodospirillales bacterium]|nr:hypothetical protein [Rhodospirillales bacterium]
MPIQEATIGQQTTADAYFYETDGTTPLAVSAPVTFFVRNQNNLLIASGSCTQDANYAAHWISTFTIPNNCTPTQPNANYSVVFVATVTTPTGIGNQTVTNTQNQTFFFSVVSQVPVDTQDTAILILECQPFTVNLVLPYSTLQTLSLRFVGAHGETINCIDTSGVNLSAPIQTNQGYVYPIPVDQCYSGQLPATIYGVFPYFAYMNYTAPNGQQETTVYTTYVVNTPAMVLMNDIQRYADRIRNKDIIPQLRVTQLDLLHFAMQGVDMLSAEPPSNFVFNFRSLPNQFFFYAQTAGCIKLLEAQYLGYGMSTFNFQGASVSLDYDPTPYILQTVDLLRQDFTKASLAKNHWARSGGGRGSIATSGGVWGPSANLVFTVSPYSMPGNFPVLPFLG